MPIWKNISLKILYKIVDGNSVRIDIFVIIVIKSFDKIFLCVNLLSAKLVDFWHNLIVFFRLVNGITVAKYTSSLSTSIKLIAKLSHFFVHFAVVYECHLIGLIENVFDLVVLRGGVIDKSVTL